MKQISPFSPAERRAYGLKVIQKQARQAPEEAERTAAELGPETFELLVDMGRAGDVAGCRSILTQPRASLRPAVPAPATPDLPGNSPAPEPTAPAPEQPPVA